VVAFPTVSFASGTHLNVRPPSTVFQIQLVFDESDPGTLV